MGGLRSGLGLGVALAAVALFAAPGADAAVTCSYDSGLHRVTISATAALDDTTVSVGHGEIRWVANGGASSQCGTATTTNTDTIVYDDTSISGTNFTINLGGGDFAPGFTNEGAGSEIEFDVDFGVKAGDILGISAGLSPLIAHIGTSGVNLNADEATADNDVTLSGPPTRYEITGGSGNDNVNAGSTFAETGSATTVPISADMGGGNDTMDGGTGADILDGGPGNDNLHGGNGDDKITPGTGDDTVNGAGGSGDEVSYQDAPGPIDLSLAVTAFQPTVSSGNDSISGTEIVTGSIHDDHLTGSANPDKLVGFDGDDTLVGLGNDDDLVGDDGDDTFLGGPGDDTLDGVSGESFGGVDTVSYADAPTGVTVDLTSGGTIMIPTSDGTDTVNGMQNATGSAFSDTLTARPTGSVLSGLGDSDTLQGAAGPDLLDGGDGNDRLLPGAGADGVAGGAGQDRAEYASAPTPVTIDLSQAGAQQTGGGGIDSFSGVEDLDGSSHDDTLVGDGNANVLRGLGGNDHLTGGAGADTLQGATGSDTLDSVDGASTDTDSCGTDVDSARADDGDSVDADCEAMQRVALPVLPVQPVVPAAGGGPAAPDTTPPVFASASMQRKTFAVAAGATAVSARAKKGSAFRYSLSEAATVTIAITSRAAGVRKGKKCVKPRRGLRGKHCKRTVRAGTLTRRSGAGASSVAFSGRIGRRALKPGSYTATLVATDAAGNASPPKRLPFKIVRR